MASVSERQLDEVLEPIAKRQKACETRDDDERRTGSVDPCASSEGVLEIQTDISEGGCVKEEAIEESPKKVNQFASFAFQSTRPLPPKQESRFLKWSSASKRNTKKLEEQAKNKTFVKMADVSSEEQERIKEKWHSLVDPTATLEVKRFQLLVAARLHARCQEVSVHKAMNRLRDVFPELTVEALAAADPELVASCITNVVHYNVKARHIVKSAQEVKIRFGGKVPEDAKSLLELTGIGRVFADLLAFVNTREAHGLGMKVA